MEIPSTALVWAFPGVGRGAGLVRMYDAATKARMFEAVARRLEAEGVRPDDVLIAVNENTLEDWYPDAREARPDLTPDAWWVDVVVEPG